MIRNAPLWLKVLVPTSVLAVAVGLTSFVVLTRKLAPGDSAAHVEGQPIGYEDGWTLAFSDEFDGSSVDRSKWTDESSAEADRGHGNPDNGQLEWNQFDNCSVSGGELTMTARRERFEEYEWTSCLLTSTPAFAFQYGYIEERAIFPAAKGFWPAFWTWQAPEVDHPVETDVYEFYSTRRDEIHFTQRTGGETGCRWRPTFDPTSGFHTYGVAIEPTGTTWYVDGVKVCQSDKTSDGATNIITNLAVYADDRPANSTNSATKRVDYIRAYTR